MPKTKEVKIEEGEIRQRKYDKLSPKQKLAKLDKELGKGVGAKKQRAKLKKMMEEKKDD